jgi:soluble lytic murein transglycosylase
MLVASETKEALGRPDVWGDDRRNIARDLVRDKSYQTAYKLASNHFMNSGHIYADLEWLSGYIALRHLKKPKTAQLHFEKFMFVVDTPISLGRAYYWLARAYQDQGQNEKARKAFKEGAVYQTSFYGLLSAEEISVPFKYDFYPPKELPNWRGAPFLKSSVFKAAILLFASGQDALGERFITHLVETLPDEQILQMTHFLEEFDRPHVLVMVGKRKASQGMSFPRSYFALHPMIEENYPVPAQLSLAIARRESEFDPRVVSPVGASGIMQVMPRTAKEMAGKIGLRYDQNRMVSDWKYNARLGTVYLQELSERFSANPVLVSVAYNAGPTRAENWSKLLGDPRSSKVDIIDWIEMIPFAETRNYVMRTIESLPIYRARLGQDPLPVPFSKSLKGSGF